MNIFYKKICKIYNKTIYNNIRKMHLVVQSIPIILGLLLRVDYDSALIIKSPIKQVIVLRALQNTITETIALNIFDQSSLYKELTCDCSNYGEIIVYTSGFIIFSYFAIKNNFKDDKIKDYMFYKKSKQYLRLFLFTTVFFLNKDVTYVY